MTNSFFASSSSRLITSSTSLLSFAVTFRPLDLTPKEVGDLGEEEAEFGMLEGLSDFLSLRVIVAGMTPDLEGSKSQWGILLGSPAARSLDNSLLKK